MARIKEMEEFSYEEAHCHVSECEVKLSVFDFGKPINQKCPV